MLITYIMCYEANVQFLYLSFWDLISSYKKEGFVQTAKLHFHQMQVSS